MFTVSECKCTTKGRRPAASMAPGVSMQREVPQVGRLCSDAAPQNICSKGAGKGAKDHSPYRSTATLLIKTNDPGKATA